MVLAVGDRVALVLVSDTSGAPVALDGSEEPIVVVFVPFAFSPVCSGEVAVLRDISDDVARAGLRLVVASCDPLPALRAWLVDEPFDGVSDFWPHGAAAQTFGVFDADRGVAGRGSFLVHDGVVQWAVQSPIGEARSADAYRSMLGVWRGIVTS